MLDTLACWYAIVCPHRPLLSATGNTDVGADCKQPGRPIRTKMGFTSPDQIWGRARLLKQRGLRYTYPREHVHFTVPTTIYQHMNSVGSSLANSVRNMLVSAISLRRPGGSCAKHCSCLAALEVASTGEVVAKSLFHRGTVTVLSVWAKVPCGATESLP
jgi:hypothetical protein